MASSTRNPGSSARNRSIGQRVAALRGERSQQWLADEMRAGGDRWSQATVWAVEKGDRPLKFAEALDLAQIFECEVVELWQPPEWTPEIRQMERDLRRLRSQGDEVVRVAATYDGLSAELDRSIAAAARSSELGARYAKDVAERRDSGNPPRRAADILANGVMDDGEHQETP